ncbi:MAG: OmpA family protein [Thermodesulfobacteriota bacterium]
MSNKTNFWGGLSNYLVPGALGMCMIYSVVSSYSHAIPGGSESVGNKSDYSALSGSDIYNPYSPELKDIFFDWNNYEIRKDAKPVLNENAEILKNEPDAYVVIESYCDSREESAGSVGAKRADSVKEYLIERGVDRGRVITANKCHIYDMQFVNKKDTLGLDCRVHFVALDTIADREKFAYVR